METYCCIFIFSVTVAAEDVLIILVKKFFEKIVLKLYPYLYFEGFTQTVPFLDDASRCIESLLFFKQAGKRLFQLILIQYLVN